MPTNEEIEEFSESSKWLEAFLTNFALSFYRTEFSDEPYIDSTGQCLFLSVTDQFLIQDAVTALENTILFTLGDRVTSCGDISGMNSHDVASNVLNATGRDQHFWAFSLFGTLPGWPMWDDVSREQKASLAEREQSLFSLRNPEWLRLAFSVRTERELLLRELQPERDQTRKQYSMRKLREELQCDAGTINKYLKELELPTASRGKKNWNCAHENAVKLFEHVRDNGGSILLRDAATKALSGIVKAK